MAFEIIDHVKILRNKKEFFFANQVLHSATSISANVSESVARESKKGFIAKMSIASKKARATRYGLRLIKKGKIIEKVICMKS